MIRIGRRSVMTGLACGLGLASAGHALGAARPALRMAYFEAYPPFSFRGDDGRMKGLLIDGIDLVCSGMDFEVTHQGFPWARSQMMVRQDKLDGFCTVPTRERQEYALFADTPLVPMHHGIFHRVGDRRPASVRSMEDLAPLTQGNYLGNGWASEVLAGQTIQWESDVKTVLTLIDKGLLDIFIGDQLTTLHVLRTLGLADKISFSPAPFVIDNAYVFGLRRTFPDAGQVVATVDQATRRATQDGRLARLMANWSS